MSTAASIIASVLIPLHKTSLLLPNVSLAEIILYKRPIPSDQTPEWHLGTINWRGVSLPLISFELMNGNEVGADWSDSKIAIFNALNTKNGFSFYGVVTQGIPRSIKISAAELSSETRKAGPAEASTVLVRGEPAVIPNLDFIESAILTAKIA